MEIFNLKNTFFSFITIIVLILSMLFFHEPAQNLLCSLAIFEQFLINTPKVCSLFDTTRLSRYNGADGGKIYLSILGIVFDVSEGRRFYGPGGSYHGFSGMCLLFNILYYFCYLKDCQQFLDYKVILFFQVVMLVVHLLLVYLMKKI